MPTPSSLPCFFSHKCCVPSHRLGRSLRPIFKEAGLDLLIDPSGPGVHIGATIEAIPFHALVFLSSSQSLASTYCRAELEAARKKNVPIFVIQWDSAPPPDLAGRKIVDGLNPNKRKLAAELRQLSAQVQVRARLHRHIECLGLGNPAPAIRNAAQAIAMESDSIALAEFAGMLANTYHRDLDPIARYWMAIALGGTRVPSSRSVLLGWRDEHDHPYSQKGIREALAMLEAAGAPGQTANDP